MIAAPIAAYIVRILPARILGTAVGGVILITNMKTFLEAVGIGGVLAILIYIVIVAVWIAALVFSIRVNRKEESCVGGDPSTAGSSRTSQDPAKRTAEAARKIFRRALDTRAITL